MYTTEIIIYVIIGILGSLLVTLVILNLRNECKHDMNYRKYVESIQIGDTFGHNSFKCLDIDDPFSENYDTQEFDPQYHVTILDIKKNYKGETWVKYCFTWRLNNTDRGEWTDEINYFLKYRTRINKRIDNINTNK